MKHDKSMVAENVLYSAISGENNYPYFEQNVVPGTSWEIEQRSEHEFYAYRFDEGVMHYIGEFMAETRYSSRVEALTAIQAEEKHE